MKKLFFTSLLIFLFFKVDMSSANERIHLPDSKEAAIEIIDENGIKFWLHGSHVGAFVTKDGKAASSGLYKSKDGKYIFTVDHLGHLKENLFNTESFFDEEDAIINKIINQ